MAELCPICYRRPVWEILKEKKCTICFLNDLWWSVPGSEELRKYFDRVTSDVEELRQLTAIFWLFTDLGYFKSGSQGIPEEELRTTLENAGISHLFDQIITAFEMSAILGLRKINIEGFGS